MASMKHRNLLSYFSLFLMVTTMMVMINQSSSRKIRRYDASSRENSLVIEKPSDAEILINDEGEFIVTVADTMLNKRNAIYLHAPIDRTITIALVQKHGDFTCDGENNSRIVTLDGWAWYDQMYPAHDDPHYMNQKNFIETRAKDFCNVDAQRVFYTNAGMIFYLLRNPGSFTFVVKFFNYDRPCNLFLPGKPNWQGELSLHYTRKFKNNCTIHILQIPRNEEHFAGLLMKIKSIKIGNQNAIEDLPYSCHRLRTNSSQNYAEIGGWGYPPGFSTYRMTVATPDICNRATYTNYLAVACPNIGIRIHIEDFDVPDQHITFEFEAFNASDPRAKQIIEKVPIKLICPKVSPESIPAIPIRLMVDECRQTIIEPGYYEMSIIGKTSGKHCGIHLLAPPGHVIEIEMENLELDDYYKFCEPRNSFNFINGWYYNKEFIPHHADHKMTMFERVERICHITQLFQRRPKSYKHSFMTSQNVGQIDYLLNVIGLKFAFRIYFHSVKEPCNTVYRINDLDPNDAKILRTYREIQNCAAYFVQEPWHPEQIDGVIIGIYTYNIGTKNGTTKTQKIDSTLDRPCMTGPTNDWMEIDGGNKFGLTSKIDKHGFQLCNTAPISPVEFKIKTFCQNVAIRLIAQQSERHNNYVIFVAGKMGKNGASRFQGKDIKELKCTNQIKLWEDFPRALDPDECEKQIISYPGIYGVDLLDHLLNKDCFITIIANHSQKITVQVLEGNNICGDGVSHLTLFEGIKFGNEVWPSERIYRVSPYRRGRLLCKEPQSKIFESAFNVAQIHFKLIRNYQSFQLKIDFIPHNNPCHVLVLAQDRELASKNFTMKTNGKMSPCQLLVYHWPWEKQSHLGLVFSIYEFQMTLDNLGKIAEDKRCHARNKECSAVGHQDYVQFYGGNNLDFFNELIEKGFEFCYNPDKEDYPVEYLVRYCRNGGLSMLSSGHANNYIKFNIIPVFANQLMPTMPFGHHIPYNHICPEPAWAKPNLLIPPFKGYSRAREFIQFIDEIPRPYEIFHQIVTTRYTEPWRGPYGNRIYSPIPDVRSLRRH